MSKDTGGTAFPVYPRNDGREVVGALGMTLRDYFAAKALPELVVLCASDNPGDKTYQEHVAGHAYLLADAMLLEREK
jgi:hypothetical protein